MTRISTRSETRIPVSRATRVALQGCLDDNEAYDTLIRRMLLFVSKAKGMPDITSLSPADRDWVLNENIMPQEVEEAYDKVQKWVSRGAFAAR